MYNGVQSPLFNAYCSSTMQGFNSSQSTSTQNQNSQINGKMCQYYNGLTKKKTRVQSQNTQQIQQLLQDEKVDHLQLQNIKIQKQLNQINQQIQYPYLIQQTFNLQMLIMKDVYSNFFPDIMREYRLYSQVISDLDMGYPIANKIKKSANNNKEWFEQNYISILKCQMAKNCQIKQTITEFRNVDVPKKAKKIIEKQQEEMQNSRIKIQKIVEFNNIHKQQSPRHLLHSASPMNQCNDIINKNIYSRKIVNSSKQVTRTESSCRNDKEDYFDNLFIFQKKGTLDKQKDKKNLQQRGSQKRYDNDYRLLTAQDDILFSNAHGNNFSNFQSDLQQQQISNQQSSVIYLAGGVKFRMNSFNDDFRNERSSSLINRDLSQKNLDNDSNKQNLSKLRQNFQTLNSSKQQTEIQLSISPKQNYNVFIEGFNSLSQNLKIGHQQCQQNLKFLQNKEEERKTGNSKHENNQLSADENNQIMNLIKVEKEVNRNSVNNTQIPCIMATNKSKNIVQNITTIGNQVLKQQNMQLLQIENLHTTPMSRTKQSQLVNTANNGTSSINIINSPQNNNTINNINNSINSMNNNGSINKTLTEINQFKSKLVINQNCNHIPLSKTPQSLKGNFSFNLKENLYLRRQETNNQNSIIVKQKQNQTIQNIIPLSQHQPYLNINSQNKSTKDNNLKLHQSYLTEQRSISYALPVTPTQHKIPKLQIEDENVETRQNKYKEKGSLNELIYFITPKNINNNQINPTLQSSVTPYLSTAYPLTSSVTPQPLLTAKQSDTLDDNPQRQQNHITIKDQHVIQDKLNQNTNDYQDITQQAQIYKNDRIKDESPPRKVSNHIQQPNQRIKNENSRIQIIENNQVHQQVNGHKSEEIKDTQKDNKDGIKIQNIQSIIMNEMESNKLNQDLKKEFQQQNKQTFQQLQRKSLPLVQNTIQFQNFTSGVQTQVDTNINDVLCFPEKNEPENRDCLIEEKRKLISNQEQVAKSQIINQDKKKQSQETLQLKDVSQIMMQKIDQQYISSSSTPFRSTSYSRQRVYQNQRQILGDIQKVNPITTQIPQSLQSKAKLDTDISQQIPIDNDIKKYKLYQLNKKQTKKNCNVLNQYSMNEKSEDKIGYKKMNPYLQNNDLFKQQKRKQENMKILQQVMNQITCQTQNKGQNNQNSIQNVILKSIVDLNENKRSDNPIKNVDDKNYNVDLLNSSRRSTFLFHDNVFPTIKQIPNMSLQDPCQRIQECMAQNVQPCKLNGSELNVVKS